jgi:DNA-binding GntR family transcriptional regulator
VVTHAAAEDGRPESLQSYAERRIKTVIANGTLPPGARLSPNLLASEFGLSHIPIREALASLAATGYVDHTPGRGYVTRRLSFADLADINRWRQVLEGEAYLIAVPRLTDDDIAEMQRLVDLMSHRARSKDRLEYVQFDREFHFIAFRRAGSEQLLRLLSYLWDAAAPYAGLEMTDSSVSHVEHLALMPALASRDAQAVIAAMDAHRSIRVKHVADWEAAQQAPGTPALPAPHEEALARGLNSRRPPLRSRRRPLPSPDAHQRYRRAESRR